MPDSLIRVTLVLMSVLPATIEGGGSGVVHRDAWLTPRRPRKGEMMAAQFGTCGYESYQERARRALPILIREARAGRVIGFSELVTELGVAGPQSLAWSLGAIGNEMLRLGDLWECPVPPIQELVVHDQTRLPAAALVPSWSAKAGWSHPQDVREVAARIHTRIFDFSHWNEVLEALSVSEG